MMTRWNRARLALLCFAVAAPATALAQERLAVDHAQGTTALSSPPERVIVFDLGALDTLDALGVPVAGVPSGPKPPALAGYEEHETVGTLFEPDLEAVNRLGPDLIVVGARSAPSYAALSQLAPTVDLSVDPEDFLPSAMETIRTLGLIFGKEAAAEARLAALRDDVAALREAAAGAGTGLVVMTTGGRMSAYGPESRFGAIHGAFGVPPAAPELAGGPHGQAVSFEFIAQANPDWLFVIDRDAAIGRQGEASAQLLDNAVVGATTAWKKGQVVQLNAGDWYLAGGGLGALERSVAALREAFAR